MTASSPTRKQQRRRLLRAALLKPRNLIVLGTTLAASAFGPILLPVGLMAYALLCYIDLSSEDFVNQVLYPRPSQPAAAPEAMPALSDREPAQSLEAAELQQLSASILAAHEKIRRLYSQSDAFVQDILGDMFQIDSLVERSRVFLFEAQTIRTYLASEDLDPIRCDITTLETRIARVSDDFSRRQYEQALDARRKHLESLEDIGRIEERLTSQVTNISLSLDSIYARMMKLKSSDSSLRSADSDQVSAQLDRLVAEVEQLDVALNHNLGFAR